MDWRRFSLGTGPVPFQNGCAEVEVAFKKEQNILIIIFFTIIHIGKNNGRRYRLRLLEGCDCTLIYRPLARIGYHVLGPLGSTASSGYVQ